MGSLQRAEHAVTGQGLLEFAATKLRSSVGVEHSAEVIRQGGMERTDSSGDGLAGTQDDVEAARVLAVHRLEARFGVPLLEFLGRVDTALG